MENNKRAATQRLAGDAALVPPCVEELERERERTIEKECKGQKKTDDVLR